MTQEEIIQAIANDKTMPFIQPSQLAEIVDFVIKNYMPSLHFNLDEAAEEYAYTNWEDSDYYEGASDGLPFDPIGHTEKCFKAGAVYDRSTVKAELLEWVKNNLDSSGRISSGELIEKIKSL